MICINCHKGGEENQASHFKRAAAWHNKCDDKGCVCQHKTGTGHTRVTASKEK